MYFNHFWYPIFTDFSLNSEVAKKKKDNLGKIFKSVTDSGEGDDNSE